ncbi:acyl-CoA synthetase [Nitriliruptor alkaliphilus]|uniref:acyl-CoA synthetase n=1 Tax=Nitriliruptor alkaliphilus TaxID=427918 RepID=UPI000698448C|nr:acyl-CoA synthetase [Nitriliruptor alkaliphilus]
MQYQLADLFESVVDRVPDRTALVCDPRRLTFRELEERSNRLAHHLLAAGIRRGDHVGCYLQNCTEYVETMIACFKIGAVPANVNYRYVEAELRYLFDNADLKVLVFDAEFTDRVEAVVPGIDTIEHLIAVTSDPDGPAEGDLPLGAVWYDTATADQPSTREGLTDGRSPDDRYMLYTGGTTGMPKGVVWRHEDVFFAGMGGGNPVAEPVTSPEELAERLDPDGQGIVMFAAPPLMHGAAFLGTFIGFFGGNTVALIRKFEGRAALELIARERIMTISLVGDAMALPLIEALEEDSSLDTSSLFVMSTAGAIMSASVRDRLKELMPQLYILDSYGSSETGYNGSATEDSSPDEGLKFKVTDRTAVINGDHLVTPGSDEVGRVAQSGHIPLEYYKSPEKNAETFVEVEGKRWVLTGDAATVDEDGVIHFLGRGTVCINSGGEKIFPEEVEAALKAHEAVRDAIVVGVPDERFGERCAAIITIAGDRTAPTQAEIEEHLSTRVARYKVPRTLQVVDEIVRSPVGKADYRWAREVAKASAVPA